MPYWLTEGSMLRGWALAEQGQEEEGITQMHQGFTAWRAMGTRVAGSYFLALQIEAYQRIGKVGEGQTALTEALTLVANTEEGFYEAELYRLKGELLLAQKSTEYGARSRNPKIKLLNPNSHVEAEACFLKAIEVAQHQQAKSLELRATVSLGRLWQAQGKQHEAHRMLAEIYNWFTEGFDTKDLQEAKMLIEELSH